MSGNGYYNELLVGLVDGATEGRDAHLDARKLDLDTDYPLSVHSYIDGEKYAIQGLPMITTGAIATDLDISTAENTKAEMKVQQLENIPSVIVVMLSDNLTGSEYELTVGKTVAFTPGPMDVDRFTLTFAYKDVLASQPLKLVKENGRLKIIYPFNGLTPVSIYTLDGKISYQDEVLFENEQAIIPYQIHSNQPYIMQVADQNLKFLIK